MPITVGLFGTGRLGSAIRRVAASRDEVEVVWAVGRHDAPEGPVDVAIDVSAPAAVGEHLAWARSTGTDLVIGATGWERDTLLVDAGQDPRISVLVAPNFSLGVALVRRLAGVLGEYAARSGPGAVDLAVTETHHRHKVDAPSGTALVLREALARGAGARLEDVQTQSLRLGEVVGDHEVSLTSGLETIALRHTAHDRDLFADGALTAAVWLAHRPAPGLFTLDDLAGDQLSSLLSLGGSATEEPAAPTTGRRTTAGDRAAAAPRHPSKESA